MKINRAKLVQHLHRIACGGQIDEAVFTSAFKTVALSVDQLLLVLAPPVAKNKTLDKDPVGVAELGKLMKALAVLAGTGDETITVDIRLEKHRLVVDEEHRGLLRLMTAQPKVIGTHVEDAIVKKLLAKAPPVAGGIPLTRALVEGIRATFSLLKATDVELFVGPEGGMVRIGTEDSDIAEFKSDELKAPTEYSLLFGTHLVDVLGIVTNYNEALLCLGGPEKFISVEDGGYRYLLNPRGRSKDQAA